MPFIISSVKCVQATTTSVGQLQIVDTSANIVSYFPSLNSLSNVLSVTSNDGVVNLNAATFNGNTSVVEKMPVQSLSISCAASDVLTYITVLNKYYSFIASVVVTGSITLTYVQYLSLSLLTSKLNAYIGVVNNVPASAVANILATTNATVGVVDTAANITTYHATTASNNRITSSVSTTPYTCSNYLADLNANSYISDSPSNFIYYLSQLQTQYTNIVSVTISDSLSLPYASYSSNLSAVKKLCKPFSVTDVPCSALSTILTNNLISVYLKDTADNIYNNLSSMTSYVKGITVSSGTLSVDYSTFTTYATYLRMTSYSSSPAYYVVTNTAIANISNVGFFLNVRIGVVDLAANIASALSTLQSNAYYILTATGSDAVVLLDFPSSYNSCAAAVKKITNLSMTNVPAGYAGITSISNQTITITVTDSPSNLLNNLYLMINNLDAITAISVTTTAGASTVTTSCETLTTYLSVFKKFGSSTITLTDSAAKMATYYDTLSYLTSQISVVNIASGSVNIVPITYAQYQQDATSIFRKVGQPYSIIGTGAPCLVVSTLFAETYLQSFTVSDTSAAITSAIATLQSSYRHITSISTDTVVVLTAAQFYANKDAIGKMANESVSVWDTSANINLNFLLSNGSYNTNSAYYSMFLLKSKIKLIHCTDTLVLDYGRQIVNVPLTSLIETAFTVPNSWVDSYVFSLANLQSLVIQHGFSNISANLSLLNTYISKITSITAYDSNIQFSYANLLTYPSVAAKMTNSLTITGVPCSAAASVAANFSAITISDSGSNVAIYASTLNGLSKISSIAMTSTPTFTYAQFTLYTTLISKLESYLITGVSMANASSFYSKNSNNYKIQISDDCSTVISNISTLNQYCNSGLFEKITTTDQCILPFSSMTAKVGNNTVSYWNVTNYISNSILINSVPSLSLSDLTAYNVKAIVSDGTSLNYLQMFSSKISSFSFTSTTPVQYSELTMYPRAVSILPSYTVSRVLCANALSIYNSKATKFAVYDIASNIQTSFTSLMNYTSKLTNITNYDTCKFTYAQYSQLIALNILMSNLWITCNFSQAGSLLSNSNIVCISIVDAVSNMQVSYLNQSKVVDITLDGTYLLASSDFKKYGTSVQKLKSPFQIYGAASSIGLQQVQDIYNNGTKSITIKVTSGSFDCATLLAWPTDKSLFTTDSVFNVTSVPSSSAAAVAKLCSSSCSFDVYDTAANISKNLSTLNQYVSNITQITASEASTVAKIQVTSDIVSSPIVAKIQTFFDVTEANCSQLDTINAFSHLSKITVVDTGANIASSFSKITLYFSKITTITASDSIPLTLAQFNTASSVLQGNVKLINIPCVSLPITNSLVNSIAVSDTSQAALANISNLSASNVASVSLTQGSPLTVTSSASYALSNQTALAKFPTASLIISDSPDNLAIKLPNLESLSSQILMAKVLLS